MTVLDAALSYISAGWNPTPIQPRSKKPTLVDWPNRVVDSAAAVQLFQDPATNIGVVLGPSSHGLCDIDLDCGEAVAAAPYILPTTSGLFGRPSNPNSHWLYRSDLVADPAIDKAVIKFDDPSEPNKKKAKLLELRLGGAAGAQTVFPPSIHETGEAITWSNGKDPDPPTISGQDLLTKARRLAATALLGRHWPQRQGTGGHNAARLLGGLLRRAGWEMSQIAVFVEAVCRAGGDTIDIKDRVRSAKDAADAFDAGKKTQGLPTLETVCGSDVANALADWLDLKRGATSRPAAAVAAGPKPVIRLGPDITAIAIETEEAMLATRLPIMQRDQFLVRPAITDARGPFNITTKTASLIPISPNIMRSYMDRSATFERFDVRSNDWIKTKPPADTADLILDRADESDFPSVRGVLLCPALRPDGSIFAGSGYDPESGLYVLSPPSMPALKAHPDKADATEALGFINTLLTDFPWVSTQTDISSRSIGLSGILSATCRAALDTVPLHAATSPTPGTGKSYLATIACCIATGFTCPALTIGQDETELHKRLDSTLLAGHPIVSLDNVSRPLNSDSLCNVLTSRVIEVRVLGQSKSPRLETRLTLFAAGNNLIISGDLIRRTLLARLDAGTETPWLRNFAMNPLKMIAVDRGKYVAACLTIARAYILAGCPGRPTALEGFEQWSNLVRGALIWLGQADPVNAIANAHADDPQRQAAAAVFLAWHARFPTEDEHTTAEIISAALPSNTDLWTALYAVVGRKNEIEPLRLGYWLRSHRDQIFDDLKLVQATLRRGSIRWKIERIV